MALISLRSRSRVKTLGDQMRADHLFIHNYIKTLLNIIFNPIYKSGRGLKTHPITFVSDI